IRSKKISTTFNFGTATIDLVRVLGSVGFSHIGLSSNTVSAGHRNVRCGEGEASSKIGVGSSNCGYVFTFLHKVNACSDAGDSFFGEPPPIIDS
ncbi:hypothetical protein GWI33_009644, partial [Rhynchophorus ferrugineus]